MRERAALIEKEMMLRFMAEGIETRRRFVFRPDVVESWPGQMCIFASRDDELAVSNLGELRGRYPRARAQVFEQGGHHTFLFFPEAYTAAVREFLDGLQ
jgi:hypothetical protein